MLPKKLLTLFLLISFAGFSQLTNIKGKIVNNQNEPLLGINIVVIEKSVGTLSDYHGNFELTKLEKSDCTLQISCMGYKTKEIPLKITGKSINLGTLVLYEGNEILNEVVVEADRANMFSRRETAYVSKLPLKDIENPQVYTTITTELLTSQVVTSFDWRFYITCLYRHERFAFLPSELLQSGIESKQPWQQCLFQRMDYNFASST